MVDYFVYAVEKDRDGDIVNCYVYPYEITQSFYSESSAKQHVRNHCQKKSKESIITDIEYYSKKYETKVLKYYGQGYKFYHGAEIHVVSHRYLRTDSNGTAKDNLDNILEID